MYVFVDKLLLKDRLFVRISRYSITSNELNKFFNVLCAYVIRIYTIYLYFAYTRISDQV